MANIYEPKKDEEIFTPFSPILGYKKMSEAFIDKCNNAIDQEMEDWSGNLVGKVKQELKWNNDLHQAWSEEMGNFLMRYQSHAELYTSMGRRNITPDTLDYRLEITSGWFVRQFENEYNPIHTHQGSMLSCVGYLKLPEGIEEEWEEDYKDHHPSHGHIQFIHGQAANHEGSNFLMRPEVGHFIVFPAHLHHCVYPFKTSGERRSFSVNFTIAASPKENVDESVK
tara:strand:+ start:462 stop:1136 length:675 start_codon:yes stop_codon:yes gene_type:complete